MTLAPLGDSAVVATLGRTIDELTLLRVRSLAAALELEKSPVIIDVVPAYTTVTVFYEIVPAGMAAQSPYDRICSIVTDCWHKVEDRWPDLLREAGENPTQSATHQDAAVIEIPVCYGGECGPDLEEVAHASGLAVDEVVSLHSRVTYHVHAIGFTPGFPYLAGLDEKLHMPRRATPRVSVPAGSVGIGGKQTGVYPVSSPGGWQLIGRTPRRLFNVEHRPPALLHVGDRVRFRPISEQEFGSWS